MSQYTLTDIDVSKLPPQYKEKGYVPLSANGEFFEEEGMGLVLEETRGGLIQMFNFGTAKKTDVYLLTEDGREIYTTGERQSVADKRNNQPIIVDKY